MTDCDSIRLAYACISLLELGLSCIISITDAHVKQCIIKVLHDNLLALKALVGFHRFDQVDLLDRAISFQLKSLN